MKRIAYIISAVLILAACRTIRENVTDNTTSNTDVHVVERIVYDTAYIRVPYERIVNVTTDTSSYLSTSFATSKAYVCDGMLFHDIVARDTTLPVEVRTVYVTRDSIVNVEHENVSTTTVEVAKPLSWWRKCEIYGFWCLFAVAVVVCIKKVLSLRA